MMDLDATTRIRVGDWNSLLYGLYVIEKRSLQKFMSGFENVRVGIGTRPWQKLVPSSAQSLISKGSNSVESMVFYPSKIDNETKAFSPTFSAQDIG